MGRKYGTIKEDGMSKMAEENDFTPRFVAAQPVWLRGREREKNLFVGFRAVIAHASGGEVRLRLAAASLYRLSVNGTFIGHGPARGPHGHFRVDEYVLTPHLVPGENVIAVEVVVYNIANYYLISQPGFLQAELVDGAGVVLAATDAAGATFQAQALTEKTQRTQRYSIQRVFVEDYRLTPGYDRWRTDAAAPFGGQPLAPMGPKALLPRRIPMSDFYCYSPARLAAEGRMRSVQSDWHDPALDLIGAGFEGFMESELACVVSHELAAMATDTLTERDLRWGRDDSFALSDRAFRILDLGVERSGFIGMTVQCRKAARLYVTFDEVRVNGDVDSRRFPIIVNAVAYSLQPGTYTVESLEPYAFRFAKWIVAEGDCTIEKVYLREYVNPDAEKAHFSCADPALNRLFVAARETFRQNAVDIFMDCPGRERAGWLCDSFFTARVALDLCGTSVVERNFLENYLLPPSFANIPQGMFPDNYPADFPAGQYIPNWALWLVLELPEYAKRSGDRDMIERYRPKVRDLFEFFRRFLNEDGLLEKLESWVFIEWSKANDFTQDVNYPSNMLYAAALEAAGRLYGEPVWLEQAEAVRQAVRRQSFDGEFFVDNAVRKDGRLEVTRNRSEVCQYYAFFTKVATPRTHPGLWNVLLNDLGPARKEGVLPDIHPANAFIGDFLRLEILSRYGFAERMAAEMKAYFHGMALTTGTLWENNTAVASCNHGFASHVAHSLFRDVLGAHEVDTVARVLRLRPPAMELAWCEGSLPTPDGFIHIAWNRIGGKVNVEIQVPAGYRVDSGDSEPV